MVKGVIKMPEYSKFEKARIISARALQISRGAPILVKTDLKEPAEIAKLEFEHGKIKLIPRIRK